MRSTPAAGRWGNMPAALCLPRWAPLRLRAEAGKPLPPSGTVQPC